MADIPPRPQLPQPPGRKRPSYLTGLFIVFGVVAALVVMLGLSTWLFLRSDRAQRLIGTAREGMNMVKDATRAPGTQALRDRGCAVAMVMPMKRMLLLIGEISPQVKDEIAKEKLPGDGTIVMCQLPAGDTEGIACTDVARIYAEATPDAPARFGVIVQRPGASKIVCQGTFGRDGRFIEPFDPKHETPR